MILKHCTFYNEFFEQDAGDIQIENGKIAAIQKAETGNGAAISSGHETCKDMTDYILLPGFVDIHIHGANGGDTCDGTAEALDKISRFLAKNGVTSFCPTTMTLPLNTLAEIAGAVAAYHGNESGAKIAGIHFEGPFISKEKKGAQNEAHIRSATCADFQQLYAASKGLMKLMTIAPEAFDSDAFIETAAQQCTVSIGHTAANETQCRHALARGARHFTHLFNAMTPMTHREAGCVGAALDSRATCELICDGAHISPTVLRNAFRILGEDRACVISDAMCAAGLGEGAYSLGGQRVWVKNNDRVARLDDGNIAASITNLFEEFKHLLAWGIDFKTALKACTINPAKVIREDSRIGSLAVGKSADFIAVDKDFNIKEVWINGTRA